MTSATPAKPACEVCGEPGRAYIQTLYGASSRAVLCPAHRKSRAALGYELKATR